MTRVLISGITAARTECHHLFCLTLVTLQTAMARTADLSSTVQFNDTVEDAHRDYLAGTYDALVCIDTLVSCPADFIVKALGADADVVLGVYPLPTIDWDAVERAKGKFDAACTYNVDLARCGPLNEHGYVVAPASAVAAAKVRVVRRREAVDAAGRPAPGAYVVADVDRPCASFGPAEFVGCVGHRVMMTTTTGDGTQRPAAAVAQ